MSRIRALILLIPVLAFVLACQAITRPFNEIQDVAGTAESMATQAIEMATQAAPLNPLATAFSGTDEAPAGSTPFAPDGTSIPGNLFDPQGVPAADWQGIPIMPEAVAGEETQGMYSFRVNASLKEVHDFYAAALPPLGWSSLFAGQELPIEVYSRDNQVLTLTITEQEGGTIVLLSIG